MKRSVLFSLLFAVFLPYLSFGQCSDAGACIIGKHSINESAVKKNHLYFNVSYGSSGVEPDINGNLNDLSIITVKLETDLELGKEFRFNASLPYSFISGPLGESNGLGDAQATVSKMFSLRKKLKLTFFLGGKFATGKINSNDSLPQRYMPSLGTNDIIAGAVVTGVNYYFGAGYQKPFGRSANYVTRLKRGDDVFFRAGFFELFNKVGVKAEILTILRVQPSSVLSSYSPETFTEVSNSNQAQVNLLGQFSYLLDDNLTFTAEAVIPFLKRDYNFDGLKRKLSINAAISYNF